MVATFSLTSSNVVHLTLSGGEAAAAGGVNLDFDATLFVQVVFILVLWAVLKPVLFDPMLKLFEEREKRIEGAIKKARRIDEESAEAMTSYNEQVAKARAEGAALREKLRAEGLRKESDLLTKVRTETQKKVDVARTQMQKDVAAVRASLQPKTDDLAKEFAKRVLGREVSG
jgi:F-type H+-transporting ATPase subunit b